jgi:RNA polymerase sigma-70 factor (ECF subfamily)
MDDSISQKTDEELVKMTLREPSSFGYIVERYEEKLKRYAMRLGVKSHEDQQDVLQDIFMKAYVNINSFDTSLSFSSWIYRIAHNESINWYRKHSVRPEGHMVASGDEIVSLLHSNIDSAETIFDKNVNAKEVAKALAAIPEKYKDAIILRYFEGMEYDEISDILKIPKGTVGTLILRGKEKLKSELNSENLRI